MQHASKVPTKTPPGVTGNMQAYIDPGTSDMDTSTLTAPSSSWIDTASVLFVQVTRSVFVFILIVVFRRLRVSFGVLYAGGIRRRSLYSYNLWTPGKIYAALQWAG